MEKRKHKRVPFQATVKIGYNLDQITLCTSTDCDKGKALSPDGDSAVVDCPECEGRGFRLKGESNENK